jgi:hypothetical protein
VKVSGFLLSEAHLASTRLDQHAVEIPRERDYSPLHARSHVATRPEIVYCNTLEQITSPGPEPKRSGIRWPGAFDI